MSEGVDVTSEELENLLINNEKFNAINAYTRSFNPIRIMGMESMEIRHSAVLSWLLTPNETHGLGDQFLKSFLCEAYRSGEKEYNIKSLDIYNYDLNDAEIRREWQNIDVFIFCKSAKLAFIVENKFHSKQHSNQLKKYKALVEDVFHEKDIKVCGIFLSLNEELPEDDLYTSIRYSQICTILIQLISINKTSMSDEVFLFVNQYIEVISEACGMSEKQDQMIQIAKDIYRNNKKAIDFIIRHGSSSDFSLAVDTLFGENFTTGSSRKIKDVEFVYGSRTNNNVSFLPKTYLNVFKAENKDNWLGCENWWMGYPVIFWLQVEPVNDSARGRVALYGEVGPISNYEYRNKLIDLIEKSAAEKKSISFNASAKKEGAKFSRFLKDNKVNIEDVQNHDLIYDAMNKLIEKFNKDFNIVLKAIESWAKYIDEK